MNRTVIGVLHPGEMGAAVGRCLTQRGHTVLWASAGRGPGTAARAKSAGLTDAGTAKAMADQAEVIVSVCPPQAALDVARAVTGFAGLYVDANAISPATAREVSRMISGGGGRYVDGGIIGPPPLAPGSTRPYLSGPDAEAVRDLFAGTALDTRVIGDTVAAASALKMAYAGWTKGSAALLLAVRALAREEGVEDTLLAEWALSQPSLEDRSRGSARSATAKGRRWIAEMEEISATMATAGLPDSFHHAAAEIFRRTSRASNKPASTRAAGAEPTAAEPASTRPTGAGPASMRPVAGGPSSARQAEKQPASTMTAGAAAYGDQGIEAVLAALPRR